MNPGILLFGIGVVALVILGIRSGVARAETRSRSRGPDEEMDPMPPEIATPSAPQDPSVPGSRGLDALTQRSREPERAAVQAIESIVSDIEEGTATADQAADGAAKARESGLPQTADKLDEHALILREIEKAENKGLPSKLPVPASFAKRGVDKDSWSRFVNKMKHGKSATVTRNFNLGIFLQGAKRLADLGVMRNVRKGLFRGRQVYLGDFVPPYTLGKFLSDPQLQYQIFVRDMEAAARSIESKHRDMIGKQLAPIDLDIHVSTPAHDLDAKSHTKISLSGLLGVFHQAGLGGLGKWLAVKDKRAAERTNKAFLDVNGLF
jgi:hypothetical protein